MSFFTCEQLFHISKWSFLSANSGEIRDLFRWRKSRGKNMHGRWSRSSKNKFRSWCKPFLRILSFISIFRNRFKTRIAEHVNANSSCEILERWSLSSIFILFPSSCFFRTRAWCTFSLKSTSPELRETQVRIIRKSFLTVFKDRAQLFPRGSQSQSIADSIMSKIDAMARRWKADVEQQRNTVFNRKTALQ